MNHMQQVMPQQPEVPEVPTVEEELVVTEQLQPVEQAELQVQPLQTLGVLAIPEAW
jgi:hypothetical protein